MRVQEPPSCSCYAPVLKYRCQSGDRTRKRYAIRIQKKHELAFRDLHALIIRGPKPPIDGVFDQLDFGKIGLRYIDRAINRRVVYHDDLPNLWLVPKRLKALVKVRRRVVAHHDYRNAHGKRIPALLEYGFMSKDVLLTKEGYDKLKKELDELKGPTRMRIADNIREAKSHGDLKENAAYHEAKLNQSRMEGRINDLENILERAHIVERPEAGGVTANLGSVVHMLDLNWGDELTVTLVGSFEADPALDMISITSPLGAMMIGKIVGDEFEVEAPAGVQKYRITGID